MTRKTDCNPFSNDTCLEYCDKRREIKVEENKKVYRVMNSNGKLFCKFRVEDCLIKKGGKRCDYLLINCDEKKAYFIELKGRHLEHALKQVRESIDHLKRELAGFSINVRIVVSRRKPHALLSNVYKDLQKKIKELEGDIQIGAKVLKE